MHERLSPNWDVLGRLITFVVKMKKKQYTKFVLIMIPSIVNISGLYFDHFVDVGECK